VTPIGSVSAQHAIPAEIALAWLSVTLVQSLQRLALTAAANHQGDRIGTPFAAMTGSGSRLARTLTEEIVNAACATRLRSLDDRLGGNATIRRLLGNLRRIA
jgi:hypothetical protein